MRAERDSTRAVRRGHVRRRAGVVTLMAMVTTPLSALASIGIAIGGTLAINAPPGEQNNIEVNEPNGTFPVTDSAGITAGPGCTQVSPTEIACNTTGIQRVAINGGNLSDTLDSDAEVVPAFISGGSGDDTLLGDDNQNDVLSGDSGNDTLDSDNGGADILSAGSGNDTIFALDGDGDDIISCGPGVDTVEADPNDTVSPNCENVITTATVGITGEDDEDD